MTKSKITGIQVLRAIAVLLVLFQHVVFYTTTAIGEDFQHYLKLDYGRVGVFLFFVISGFVMARCMRENRFLLNRVIRIYPAYWLAIPISFILVGAFFPWYFKLNSFFLIGMKATYPIPYWTLIYEMFFYCVIYLFSKITKNDEQVFHLAIAWLISIYIFNLYQPVETLGPIHQMFFSPINYFFIAGLIFSIYKDEIKKIPQNLMLSIGLVLWMISIGYSYNMYIVNAAAYGFIVLYSLEKLTTPWLCKLGDYSYGIYLIHVPITLLLIHVFLKVNPSLPLKIIMPSTFLFSFIFSCIFGAFEVKMHNYLKTKVKKLFEKRAAFGHLSTENL